MTEIWRHQRKNRKHSSGDIKGEAESAVVETSKEKQSTVMETLREKQKE
jgi:hypothetical protein